MGASGARQLATRLPGILSKDQLQTSRLHELRYMLERFASSVVIINAMAAVRYDKSRALICTGSWIERFDQIASWISLLGAVTHAKDVIVLSQHDIHWPGIGRGGSEDGCRGKLVT